MTVRVLCLVLAALWIGGRTSAQEPWRLVRQEAGYEFSSSLDFRLEMQSADLVTEVILFYGREGENIVRRIYPAFREGTNLSISHSESLERGQYAPGTRLQYWWRLYTSSGARYDTPIDIIDYTDTARAWESLSGDGIVLYYYAMRPAAARDLLARAEASLDRIRQEIGVTPERPISVYVYRNEADMRQAVATRSDDYDARVTTLGVAVDEHTLILLGNHPDLGFTMAHELSHIVVGLATDNPYSRLPRWLDEGLAMLAEGDELPRQNAAALRRGIANDELLSVRSMTSYSGRSEQVDLYYGAAHSVVSFLIDTYGRDRMTALLDAFAEGSTQDDALTRAYGLNLDQLDALWRQSLGLGPRGGLVPHGLYAGMSLSREPA